MRLPPIDTRRIILRICCRWQWMTRGTTRAAGIAMCTLLLCAVVVGASQVFPFTSQHEAAAKEDAVSPDPPLDDGTRQLEPSDYNESWLQAAGDWGRLGDVARRHQVLITPSGQLAGRIMTFVDWRGELKPLAGAAVHLMQQGQMAAETTTDAEGRFIADGLSEGTYSLIAESEDGLLAYALHLRSAAASEQATAVQLHSMAATRWDAQSVIAHVLDYWHSAPPIERTREPAEDMIPRAVRPVPQSGLPAITLSHHQVRLQGDGRLIGRLRRLHPVTGRPIVAQGVDVSLFRNGTLQAVTWTDDIGYFEFPRVAPGVYSLVATGAETIDPVSQIMQTDDHGLHHGFLSIGIQVLPAADSLVVAVAFEESPALEIDAALVDVADLMPFLGSPVSVETEAVALETPFAGTGAAAGGAAAGGAGAAAGGGAGLGPALAAGAGAGLAVLADDGGVISPASP